MQGMFACIVHFFLALFNFILICFVPYFERRFDPNDLPNLNKILRFVLAYSLIDGFFCFVLFFFLTVQLLDMTSPTAIPYFFLL